MRRAGGAANMPPFVVLWPGWFGILSGSFRFIFFFACACFAVSIFQNLFKASMDFIKVLSEGFRLPFFSLVFRGVAAVFCGYMWRYYIKLCPFSKSYYRGRGVLSGSSTVPAFINQSLRPRPDSLRCPV